MVKGAHDYILGHFQRPWRVVILLIVRTRPAPQTILRDLESDEFSRSPSPYRDSVPSAPGGLDPC